VYPVYVQSTQGQPQVCARVPEGGGGGHWNRPFAKYQLSDGSPLVSMVSIDKNVKFPLNIRYFLKV
jgi:hypothetical protein